MSKKYTSMFEPRQPLVNNDINLLCNKIQISNTPEELYKVLFKKEIGNDTPPFLQSIYNWLGGNYEYLEYCLHDIVNEYIQDIIKIHPNENIDILRKYIIEWVLRYEKQSNHKSTALQPNRSKKQLIERIKQCVTLPELYNILFQNTEDKYYLQFLSSFDNYILEGNPKIINDLLNSKCYGIIITDNIGDNHYTAIYNTIKNWCFNYREIKLTKKVLDNKILNVIGGFADQIETFENKSKSDNFLFEIGNKLPNLSNEIPTDIKENLERISDTAENLIETSSNNKSESKMKISENVQFQIGTSPLNNITNLYQCIFKNPSNDRTRVLIVEATGLSDLELKLNRNIVPYKQDKNQKEIINQSQSSSQSYKNIKCFTQNIESQLSTQKDIESQLDEIDSIKDFYLAEIKIFVRGERFNIEENFKIWR